MHGSPGFSKQDNNERIKTVTINSQQFSHGRIIFQVKCPSNITNQDCPIAANFSRVIKLPAISSQADNDARFQSLFDKGQGGQGRIQDFF